MGTEGQEVVIVAADLAKRDELPSQLQPGVLYGSRKQAALDIAGQPQLLRHPPGECLQPLIEDLQLGVLARQLLDALAVAQGPPQPGDELLLAGGRGEHVVGGLEQRRGRAGPALLGSEEQHRRARRLVERAQHAHHRLHALPLDRGVEQHGVRWRRRQHRQVHPRTRGCSGLREPEVEQLRTAVDQHDVARLQIAVDDALAVRSIEGVRDLHGVLEPQIQWQGTFLKSVRECLAIQVLHHQEIGAVFVTDVVERTDVRMVEGGNRPRLAFKPLPEVRVRRDIRR